MLNISGFKINSQLENRFVDLTIETDSCKILIILMCPNLVLDFSFTHVVFLIILLSELLILILLISYYTHFELNILFYMKLVIHQIESTKY